ncbi:bifunctional DNA-formamidopyrimidine glycosylase/DNA-(apurinic or apyrimidinic site) lyase [Acidobacteria bacterium AH-259-D05]|nr:bifunctional DNA-formamidopyrimidine glycosylase/DNA-(apurinic or apyrimidinic site) lyase [Acidobacteria bacterium AH-259-D05]
MPELPEVETIRRGLEPHVVGRTIADVLVGDSKVLQIKPPRLIENLAGQTIQELNRRGKFLIFELDRHYLVFHFGMTGQLTFRHPNRADSKGFSRHSVTGLQRARQHAPDRHTHLQIHLQRGGALLFRDIRKFGKVFLMEAGDNVLPVFFQRLGLEPFSLSYNLEAFLQGFRNRKLRIKSLLLDQRFVAGMGNIYADEVLFQAGVHPARTVPSLRRWEKEILFETIPEVLKEGIESGGTSFRDYVKSDGEAGNHQENLRVYGREGESCHRCGTIIQRIVIGQRGTRFCSTCQPRRGTKARPHEPTYNGKHHDY